MNITTAVSILLSLQHSADIFFRPILLEGNTYAYVEPWKTECFLGPNQPNFKDLNDTQFREAVNQYLQTEADRAITASTPAGYQAEDCSTGHFGFIDEQLGTTILLMHKRH